MSGFLYFKPGQNSVNADKVKEWGLGHAFTTRACGGQCQGQTPSGGAGIVFADKKRMGDSQIKMDMPNQVWGKIPKSDVWVGYWKDALPTPESLAREKQLPGFQVSLAADRLWTIPLVRRFDRDSHEHVSALPCYMHCNDDGEWVRGNVLDIHAHLWELVTPFAEDILNQLGPNGDGEGKDFQPSEICKVVTTLLQTNYYVGPGELSVLNAFAEEASTHGAILAACDFLTFIDWLEDQKKSEAEPGDDGLNTADGEAA